MIRSTLSLMLIVMAHEPHKARSSAVRVLVVAHRRVTRSALRQVVERQPDVDVVGVVATLPAAVRVIRELRPHVVFVDRTLLGRPGLPWLTTLVRDAPEASIFVIGMGDHPRLADQALRAGGAGYIRLDEADVAIPAALATAVPA